MGRDKGKKNRGSEAGQEKKRPYYKSYGPRKGQD